MELGIGGEFSAMGKLEYYLLRQHGLTDASSVLDVGCGSGRLALQLAQYGVGKYTGTDVVPDFLNHAQSLVSKENFDFNLVEGLSIQEPDNCFDFVCFFSVMTHLQHHESYIYLAEAARVAASGGKIVISFLEYCIPSHWPIFQHVVDSNDPTVVLDQFVSRDALEAWSEHLNLEIVGIFDGDKPHIDLSETITFDDGRTMEDRGHLGQSVVVFNKP